MQIRVAGQAQHDLGAEHHVGHAELRSRGQRVVVVDMVTLDAMAAACISELLAWLSHSHVQDLDADARYQIRFRLNRSVTWQAGAVRTLACFDTELVTIEP